MGSGRGAGPVVWEKGTSDLVSLLPAPQACTAAPSCVLPLPLTSSGVPPASNPA